VEPAPIVLKLTFRTVSHGILFPCRQDTARRQQHCGRKRNVVVKPQTEISFMRSRTHKGHPQPLDRPEAHKARVPAMRAGGRRCFRWPAQVQRRFQQAADAFQVLLCAGMHPPEVTNLVQPSIQAHAASARAPPGLISQRDYVLQPRVVRHELPWVKWPDEKPQGG